MAGQPRASHLERRYALLLALFILAIGVVAFPSRPAVAGPVGQAPTAAPSGLCTVEEWQADLTGCVNRLSDVAAQRAQCLKAPIPETPDSGLAGWFASRPEASMHPGEKGIYTDYGYAGYTYTTYDIGCTPTLMHPDYKFENTIANGEFMLATAVTGASNALRERAWDPSMMWGWADPLVEKATRSIYDKVFTVFGAVTLVVIGVYLLWRSRQAEMSLAMTTVGWALLVTTVVTALAAWPVYSAHLADKALVTSLAVVHDAVGPPSKEVPPAECTKPNPEWCRDIRPPATRASDTTVKTMLYRNWLRGLLGTSESATADKYGMALYESRSLNWAEVETLRRDPLQRDVVASRKAAQWMKVAEQIRTEDPEAYEYLTGARGMDRIGAGAIALLSSVTFALFDIVASLLVLLGFLVFRWAVIAAPILGTVGMLRPASSGFRRLMNAVVAALFNIVVFGAGAAIYLYAVDLIMTTSSLPGWLQMILVLLCGVVGWLLLRPYRRITQLGGSESASSIATAGWNRRERTGGAATTRVSDTSHDGQPIVVQAKHRSELRSESPAINVAAETTNSGAPSVSATPPDRSRTVVGEPRTYPMSGIESIPDVYIPSSRNSSSSQSRALVGESTTQPAVRVEAKTG